MFILGFLLITVSTMTSFLTNDNFASIIIPAVGGAIVEVIAGTSLIVYNKTLTQLNRYYNSLHDNERFLSIVNLVSKISNEKQDEMYAEIIKSQTISIFKTNVK